MGRQQSNRSTRIRWRWVLGAAAAAFLLSLAAAYWMLAALDVNRFKPEIVEAVKTATDRKLTLGGDITLQFGLRPTLAVEDVLFENAPWGSRKDMLHLKRLEFQIAALPLLFGRFDVRRIRLVSPDLLLEKRADGTWNLPQRPAGKAPEPTGPPSAVLRQLTFSAAKIENGRLAWRDDRSGQTTEVLIQAADAGMTGLESPIRLKMRAIVDKKVFRISGNVGRLFQLLDGDRPWPVDLSLTADGLRIDVSGAVRRAAPLGGIDLEVRGRADSLDTAKPFLGDLPLPPLQTVSADFRLTDPKDGRLRFSDVAISADKGDITGWFEVDTRGRRPRVAADLRSKRLAFGRRSKSASRRTGSKKTAKVFSDEPFDFRKLRQIDADVHLVADRLQSPLLTAENIDMSLKVENGSAQLRPIMVRMGDGFAEGQASVRPTTKGAWVSLRLSARQIPFHRVWAPFSRAPVLAGKMDADLRLLGQGRSVAELMAGLDGKIFWMMGKGEIRNRHIDLVAGETAGKIARMLDPFSENKDVTGLNCMVAEIEIERGIAQCKGLLLDTARTTIAGEGEIDLAAETIDIHMDPSPKRGLGLKGLGGLGLSLGELGNPFKLGGTLASPQVALDTTGAAITFGKVFGAFTLTGPIGIAAAMADFSSGDDNPCLKAIQAHKQGGKPGG
jgi:uncharacterized protein involved in outer membrane biogenesis